MIGGFKLAVGKNFRVVESAPNAEEYLALRTALAWETYSKDCVEDALHNSLFCVTVYDQSTVIGMGRIVGDNKLCFYIQDIMVIPGAQRQGVGTIIMERILNYLHKTAIAGAYIGLMSKKNMESFYETFGFVKRPNEFMGAGMILPDFMPIYCLYEHK